MKKISYYCDVCNRETGEGNLTDVSIRFDGEYNKRFEICGTCFNNFRKNHEHAYSRRLALRILRWFFV